MGYEVCVRLSGATREVKRRWWAVVIRTSTLAVSMSVAMSEYWCCMAWKSPARVTPCTANTDYFDQEIVSVGMHSTTTSSPKWCASLSIHAPIRVPNCDRSNKYGITDSYAPSARPSYGGDIHRGVRRTAHRFCQHTRTCTRRPIFS